MELFGQGIDHSESAGVRELGDWVLVGADEAGAAV
jgi:hypothetical protein